MMFSSKYFLAAYKFFLICIDVKILQLSVHHRQRCHLLDNQYHQVSHMKMHHHLEDYYMHELYTKIALTAFFSLISRSSTHLEHPKLPIYNKYKFSFLSYFERFFHLQIKINI